jgi:AcrR family transcriptional regulator
MKRKEIQSIKSISPRTMTQVKDPELVRKHHLLIAKKATKLFIKNGYHQTSMRDISKATGMAIGMLYCYIKKKEDILCLVFDVFYDTLEKILEEETSRKWTDPEKQLRTALKRSLQVTRRFSDELALMYRESRFLPKRALREAISRESQVIRYFEEILTAGNEKGVFNVKDPYFMAGMIVYQSSIYHLRKWYFRDKYTDAEKMERLEECIMDSVLRRKPGKTK